MKRKLLIMHQTVVKHDAIGNDIEMMYHSLCEEYECRVFAEKCLSNQVKYIDENECTAWLSERETIVVYHHSINWRLGSQLLMKSAGRIIIRYHNVTPSSFFIMYNQKYYEQCEAGRNLTDYLAKNIGEAIWLCDSRFNAQDITEWVERERIFILPPFHKLHEWETVMPDEPTLEKLVRSTCLNLLYVGRIVPNKGIEFLLDIVFVYVHEISHNVMLRIVGKFDDALEPFNRLLHNKIRRYQLENHVEFIGEINDSVLMSYYLGCDVFLCVSEHEGFCVPIIEAQYFGLPIIARDKCAVPDTVGEKQLLLGDDERTYAAAIQMIWEDDEYKNYLINNGKNNLERRFRWEKCRDDFMKIIRAM